MIETIYYSRGWNLAKRCFSWIIDDARITSFNKYNVSMYAVIHVQNYLGI